MADGGPDILRIHVHDAAGECMDLAFPVYEVTHDQACAVRNVSLTAAYGGDAHGEVWPLEDDWAGVDDDGWDESGET